jgi:hypothetical protein
MESVRKMRKQTLRDVAVFKGESKKVLEEIARKPEQEKQANVAKVLKHFNEQDKKIRIEQEKQEIKNRAKILYQQRTRKQA